MLDTPGNYSEWEEGWAAEARGVRRETFARDVAATRRGPNYLLRDVGPSERREAHAPDIRRDERAGSGDAALKVERGWAAEAWGVPEGKEGVLGGGGWGLELAEGLASSHRVFVASKKPVPSFLL